jgi:peptidoglycan hydrolase CwlO-like protein
LTPFGAFDILSMMQWEEEKVKRLQSAKDRMIQQYMNLQDRVDEMNSQIYDLCTEIESMNQEIAVIRENMKEKGTPVTRKPNPREVAPPPPPLDNQTEAAS